MIYFAENEAHFIKEIVSEVSSKLKSMASSSEDDQSCEKFLSSAAYGVASVIGSIGVLVFVFLVVFPLFGLFFFKVVVPVMESVLGIDEDLSMSSSFGKHNW